MAAASRGGRVGAVGADVGPARRAHAVASELAGDPGYPVRIMDLDLARLRTELHAVAEEAGAAILSVYERDFAVERKADDSPLTEADLASNRVILARLKALTPVVPVLSEESSQVPYEQRRAWPRFWLVDPLDGTKEFVKRNGEFTVNVALIDHGRPALGVVYAPVLRVGYSGVVGDGALRWQDGTDATPIHCTPPGERLRVAASRSHANAATEAYLDRLREHWDVEVVSKGSSLKICMVAEGAAHVYPRTGPTMEWDTAAADAVVTAAGGVLLDASDGAPLTYNKADLRNPHFVVAWSDEVPLP